MQSYMKIVIVLVVVALIAVVGMILLVRQPGNEETPDITPQETAAPQESPMPEDDAPEISSEPMYEGILAGLSEEEIAAMALAEENSSVRAEEDDTEKSID